MMRLRLPDIPRLVRMGSLSLPAGCCPDVEGCLASGTLLLEQAGIETARLDAECLLAAVLGCPRWRLRLAGPPAAVAAAGFSASGEGSWAFEGEPEAMNAALDRARAAGALLLEVSQESKDLEAVLAEAVGGESPAGRGERS